MTQDYTINENGVITNPEVISASTDNAEATIELAQIDEGWVIGYKISITAGCFWGCSSPCMASTKPWNTVYQDKTQARIGAIRKMREDAIRNRVINYCSPLLYQMEDEARQLELFY